MKVADLTVDELKALMREWIHEALEEYLDEDSDQFELSPEFAAELKDRIEGDAAWIDGPEAFRRLGL